VVALFLLSQVFLIVSHGPLVHTLAAVMLMSDLETIQIGTNKVLKKFGDITSNKSVTCSPPKETLKSLETLNESSTSEELYNQENSITSIKEVVKNAIDELQEFNHPSTSFDDASTPVNTPVLTNTSLNTSIPNEEDLEEIKQLNVTDEEKEQRLALESPLMPHQNQNDIFESLAKKPFLETITNSLLCTENDYAALFALCLLYALANNQVIVTNSGRNLSYSQIFYVIISQLFIYQGISHKILDIILSPFYNNTSTKNSYNELLMDRLIHIITLSCQTSELCQYFPL